MIRLNVDKRGSGKTTRVIAELARDTEYEKDNRAVILVPHEQMKVLYPKPFHYRIFTFSEFIHGGKLDGLKFSRFIIDEGFMPREDELARLYYELGRTGKDVEVYGSLKGE